MFRRKDERAARSVEKLKALNEKHKETEIEDLSDEERREFRKLRAGAGYNPHAMEYLMGSLLFAEENMEEALDHLRRSEKANPGNPGLHNKIGDVYMEMERFEDARKSFENALSLDPENANAYLVLCRSRLKRGMYGKAAHAAMESVGLQYSNPRGHFYNKSVTAPEQAAQKVNTFLSGRLDEKAMAASISPALYRHRA